MGKINSLPFILLGLASLFSCKRSDKAWRFSHKIILPEEVRALGIAQAGEHLWISDPDHNRVLRIDQEGRIVQTVTGIQRPMNIAVRDNQLLIPSFYNDDITVFEDGNINPWPVDIDFDAPSSISVLNDLTAFADFYHHRVLILKEGVVSQISEEGRTDGLLYYPTDVELYQDKVVVADAYNNRVQVFDQEGNFKKVIGWQENIRVATGLDVFEDKIYVTDYYGARVLVYDFDGRLLTIFEGHFNKPSDILVTNTLMYVANYGENTLSVYDR